MLPKRRRRPKRYYRRRNRPSRRSVNVDLFLGSSSFCNHTGGRDSLKKLKIHEEAREVELRSINRHGDAFRVRS